MKKKTNAYSLIFEKLFEADDNGVGVCFLIADAIKAKIAPNVVNCVWDMMAAVEYLQFQGVLAFDEQSEEDSPMELSASTNVKFAPTYFLKKEKEAA